MEELRQNAEPDIVIMLVGNKVDLVEKDPNARQVLYDTANEFARTHGMFFSESSAVTSYNVKHIFEYLLQEIYNNRTKGGRNVNTAVENTKGGGIHLASVNNAQQGCDQSVGQCSAI
jgi:Rab family protein